MAWFSGVITDRAVPAVVGTQALSVPNRISTAFLAPAHGDLIFRTGRGFWSPFFSAANKAHGYSHVGVVVLEGGGFFVLHAQADDFTLEGGVLKTPLETFLAESVNYIIKRNEMPGEAKVRFVTALEDMLGLKAGFDSQFTLEDRALKVYCTEFVWLAAQRAGVLDLGHIQSLSDKAVILVDSIFESPRLGQSYKPESTWPWPLGPRPPLLFHNL